MKAGLWHYYSSVPWSAWSTGRAKDPWIPQLCSGRKSCSLSQHFSASLQESCTNHRTQKGESFIQNPAVAAALHLALFEELMETSQQVVSSRWARDYQSGQLLHSTVTGSLWKHLKNPHSSFISLVSWLFCFLNRDVSTNRKFKTPPLHLQSSFWVSEVHSVNAFKISSAAMKAEIIFFPF